MLDVGGRLGRVAGCPVLYGIGHIPVARLDGFINMYVFRNAKPVVYPVD